MTSLSLRYGYLGYFNIFSPANISPSIINCRYVRQVCTSNAGIFRQALSCFWAVFLKCVSVYFGDKRICGGKARQNAIFIETDLKPASEPVRPHAVSQKMAKFCLKLCPLLYQKSSRAFDLGNLQVTTQLSLPVRAFLKSLCPHLPTSSNWSLWWIEGPSIQ